METSTSSLTSRTRPSAPVFVVREPLPRDADHMCEEDRRRFVNIAFDAARERLRAYRLLCTAGKAFYEQRCAREGGFEGELPNRI